MLIIESRMIIIIQARSPISFKHLSFLYMYLKLHQTTYHINIDFLIIKSNGIWVVYIMQEFCQRLIFTWDTKQYKSVT